MVGNWKYRKILKIIHWFSAFMWSKTLGSIGTLTAPTKNDGRSNLVIVVSINSNQTSFLILNQRWIPIFVHYWTLAQNGRQSKLQLNLISIYLFLIHLISFIHLSGGHSINNQTINHQYKCNLQLIFHCGPLWPIFTQSAEIQVPDLLRAGQLL